VSQKLGVAARPKCSPRKWRSCKPVIRQQVALDLQGKNEAPSFLHLGSLFAVHCKAKSFACRIGHNVSVSSQKDINTGVAPSICDFHSTQQYILPNHIPAISLNGAPYRSHVFRFPFARGSYSCGQSPPVGKGYESPPVAKSSARKKKLACNTRSYT
jgi:hypothetical protein